MSKKIQIGFSLKFILFVFVQLFSLRVFSRERNDFECKKCDWPHVICMDPLNYCVNDSIYVHLYLNMGNTHTLDIQWYRDGIAISGANTGVLIATDTGFYSVHITFIPGYGCPQQGDTLSYELYGSQISRANQIPQVIEQYDTLLRSVNPGYYFQWYHNGWPIPGATQQYFWPTENGYYKLLSSTNYCPPVFSDSIYFHFPVPAPITFYFSGFNGSGKYLSATYSFPESDNCELIIYDLTGRIISNSKLEPGNQKQVFFNNWTMPSGLYFYSVLQNGAQVYQGKVMFMGG